MIRHVNFLEKTIPGREKPLNKKNGARAGKIVLAVLIRLHPSCASDRLLFMKKPIIKRVGLAEKISFIVPNFAKFQVHVGLSLQGSGAGLKSV